MAQVYEYPNPFWLSDIFIFKKHKDLGTIYVKVNYQNKIEEIGIDIEKRFFNTTFDDITSSPNCIPATSLHKSILNRIGNEYWYSLKNRMK